MKRDQIECPRCHGEGLGQMGRCVHCNGRGLVTPPRDDERDEEDFRDDGAKQWAPQWSPLRWSADAILRRGSTARRRA